MTEMSTYLRWTSSSFGASTFLSPVCVGSEWGRAHLPLLKAGLGGAAHLPRLPGLGALPLAAVALGDSSGCPASSVQCPVGISGACSKSGPAQQECLKLDHFGSIAVGVVLNG